jgi:hypothetical protein
VFGSNLVVALPSTLHGHFWDRRQVDLLLKRRQLISVEEHIAPIRPDGLVQTPNIVDDIEELRSLFRYLRNKGVWYATGSEVASYVVARDRSLIHDVSTDGFTVRYDGRVDRPMLTLRIDAAAVCTPAQPTIGVIGPDGRAVDPAYCRFDSVRFQHLVTIPVMSGRYSIHPQAE